MIGPPLGLEAAAAAFGLAPLQPGRDRQVEQDGEVGSAGRQHLAVQPVDPLEPHLASQPLIDAGRIDVAVAEHDGAARDRRLDQPGQMIRPRGGKEQKLGQRVPALDRTLDQQPADRLGTGRAAGLAGADDLAAQALEPRGEAGELGALAGTLAALDRQEESAPGRHPGQPPPQTR